jgi:hypothetical protein
MQDRQGRLGQAGKAGAGRKGWGRHERQGLAGWVRCYNINSSNTPQYSIVAPYAASMRFLEPMSQYGRLRQAEAG